MIEEIIFLFHNSIYRGISSPITGISLSEAVRTVTKIPFMYSFFWELRGLSPNFHHIHVSVSDLYSIQYSQDRSIYLMQQNRHIDCGNININRLQTHTWMRKLGLWPSNSFSGNICFEFLLLVSLQCVSSKGKIFIFLRLGMGAEPRVRGYPPPPPPTSARQGGDITDPFRESESPPAPPTPHL